MFEVDNLGRWMEQWGGFLGSLFGAGATIGAGIFAWSIAKRGLAPVQGQLAEMRRQSAAAARGAISQLVSDLEEELRATARADELIRLARHTLEMYDVVSQWNFNYIIIEDNIERVDTSAGEMQALLLPYMQRNPEKTDTSAVRQNLSGCADMMSGAFARLHTAFRHETRGAYEEDGEVALSATEIGGRRIEAEVSVKRFTEAFDRYQHVMAMELEFIWTRIRRLESEALGHH